MESQGQRRGRAQGERARAVSGLELLAGAALPVRMNLNVEITRAGGDGEPPDLPRGLGAGILEHEEKLLAWLGRNPARRAEFLADPVASLRAAGIKLDEATLAVLAERHSRTAATDVLPPGLTIESVDVKVAPKARKETSAKARKQTSTKARKTSSKKREGA
jgi:hypothetical protein